MGNELKQLNIQEQQEIERILSYLSAMCADNEYEISANVDILCHIDFVQRLSLLYLWKVYAQTLGM